MPARRVANPPNPYLSQWCDWLGPPPAARIEVYEEHARSIIAHNDSPDISFDWSVNPYRGCQHACAYCYARPTHEYLGLGAGTDFDTRITVKVNAPELLERELARRSWRGASIAFSGVTDCYQPQEVIYRVTRRCLEACVARANPVSIVTKSCLIRRDIDVLTELHARAPVHVYISVAFADDALARLVEPHAPSPARRFEALRALHDAGLPVGVLCGPVIPGLNDREIPRVLERAADCGATVATYLPLRLPGSVKNVFLERIRTVAPDRAARIEQFVRDMRGGELNDSRFGHRFRAHGVYWHAVRQLFDRSVRRFGLHLDRPKGNCGAEPAHSAERPMHAAARMQLPLFETL